MLGRLERALRRSLVFGFVIENDMPLQTDSSRSLQKPKTTHLAHFSLHQTMAFVARLKCSKALSIVQALHINWCHASPLCGSSNVLLHIDNIPKVSIHYNFFAEFEAYSLEVPRIHCL